MTGNVREMCRDVYRRYDAGPRVDPAFPPDPGHSPAQTVVRGGSYVSGTECGRTTDRSAPLDWVLTAPDVGFRLVIECLEDAVAAPEAGR